MTITVRVMRKTHYIVLFHMNQKIPWCVCSTIANISTLNKEQMHLSIPCVESTVTGIVDTLVMEAAETSKGYV